MSYGGGVVMGDACVYLRGGGCKSWEWHGFSVRSLLPKSIILKLLPLPGPPSEEADVVVASRSKRCASCRQRRETPAP